MSGPILPGAALGMIGGGQLGRMFASAARRMGYRVHVLADEPDAPAAQIADRVIEAAYDDVKAVEDLAAHVAAVTYEFENLCPAAVAAAHAHAPLRPGPLPLEVSQHRLREKRFVSDLGLATAPFLEVAREADVAGAVDHLGLPLVLKTASSGYDGKGQLLLRTPDDAERAWQRLGSQLLCAEKWVTLAGEMSVVIARGLDGELACYEPIENTHEHHILDVSIMPASAAPAIMAQARDAAARLAAALDYVGVLCVEFFVTDAGELLVNELAPRPHNSGHLTIEACATSQFEQQVRAMCGLPLGSTAITQPAAMVNLLGDLWGNGEPDWPAALRHHGATLHLYGKAEARPGRKMGHITVVGDDAAARARAARAAL